MSSTAKKIDPKTRNKLIAAIQIEYKRVNPYLDDKEELRAARLDFVTKLLGLSKPCHSITDLSDKQLGLVLGELRQQNGQEKSKRRDFKFGYEYKTRLDAKTQPAPVGGADVIHLASNEQIYTINKLVAFIGWSEQRFNEFLFQKTRCRSRQMMTFKKASGFTMILFNVAAAKSLRADGVKGKISRAQIAAHLPKLKTKLGIDQ